jgi:hypothetical protein
MIFRATFFRVALADSGGVSITLSMVIHTRGSGEALVGSEEAVETPASGPVA